jgi:hypothetical protein
VTTILFLLAHVPLALALKRSPMAAAVHPLITVLFGLWWSSFGTRLERLAAVAAYVAGAEVLWRMTDASPLWEFGKYATIVLLATAWLQRRRLRVPRFALLYFLLLLPSVPFTVASLGGWDARVQLSFNLSGPLALAVCTAYFSNLHLDHAQRRRIFVAVVAPLISVAAISLLGIFTSDTLAFRTQSNADASGGFGPNQVSAALGLGALIGLLALLDAPSTATFKAVMLAVITLLGAQSALTFSRGGVYNAVAAAGVACVFLVRDRRSRRTLALATIVLAVTVDYFVLPQLDQMTGGALGSRFENFDPTGRDEILRADLNVFAANPVLGVGPGRALSLRDVSYTTAAHTEFSRLLAEHGALGLGAIALLFVMALRHVRKERAPRMAGIAAALVTWTFIYMLHAGMRLVAPSFIFGLSAAHLLAAGEAIRRAPPKVRPYRTTWAQAAPVTPQGVVLP